MDAGDREGEGELEAVGEGKGELEAVGGGCMDGGGPESWILYSSGKETADGGY